MLLAGIVVRAWRTHPVSIVFAAEKREEHGVETAFNHQRGLPSSLGVTNERPEKLLLDHTVDGFSLAMDFKVTNSKRARLSQLLQDFDRMVLQAGGRFYFAKNSETSAEAARAFLGEETIVKFNKLKQRCDPNNLLESDLFRRVFGQRI